MSEPDAYAALHAAIVAGELSPGERLVEEELAERLRCSRGAVRGSLVRLAYEGLVVRSPNRGARVRRYSLEEAVEVLEARAALESLASGYAALRRTGEEARELEALIEDMRRLQREGELLEMSERNALLHKRILEIAGHEVARGIAEQLHSQVVRFQFRTVFAAGRPPKSLAEHERIVAAISAGDRAAAELAMREHLGNVAAVLGEVAAPAYAAL